MKAIRTHKEPQLSCAGWMLTAALASSGCHRPAEPTLCVVEGVLLINGEPAANANVAFHPVAASAAARCPVGRTDGQGEFRLTTRSNDDGAPAGDYCVTFVWPDETVEIDECECPDPLIHDKLKGLYAAAEQSEFRVTIGPGSNHFRFNAWRPRGDEAVP